MIFFLLPKNKFKRRVLYAVFAIMPVLGSYVAIGWGRPPVGIWKPVGSISTMFGKNQDGSSLWRDIENYNLLVTLKSSPILGTGFGSEYIQAVRASDISEFFAQWRYMPHNSLLGVIAFTGMLGFAGLWQMVLVATYLHVQVYRRTKDTVPRIASMSCLVGILIIEVQMWGDIGFNHPMVQVMLAIAVGLSARLPTLTGVWRPPNANKTAKATA
jgi:O-antigen ligase